MAYMNLLQRDKMPRYYDPNKPVKINKKLVEQEALQTPWIDPIDLLTFGTGRSVLSKLGSKGVGGILGALSTKGATKMGLINKAIDLGGKALKKGWPILAGYALGSMGGGNKDKKEALPSIEKPVLTKEQFQGFVNQINSILGGNIPINPYSAQAAKMANNAIPMLQRAYAPLIESGKEASSALTELASKIPLTSVQGPSYYDTALLKNMGAQISELLAQSQPPDLSFKSLLRAKYARRALQTALPAYASLVSSGRQAITPSSVVPNLITAAYEAQMRPHFNMLSALPGLLTGAQTTLRQVGAGQQAKAAMLLNTLLGGQTKMDTATLTALAKLGALDPAIKDLILQNYVQQ